MAASSTESDLAARARDVFHTVVGFGVLGIQRLQIGRRSLTKDVADRVGSPDGDLSSLVRQVQEVVDPVLDVVEARLPLTGRLVVRRARRAARDATGTTRR